MLVLPATQPTRKSMGTRKMVKIRSRSYSMDLPARLAFGDLVTKFPRGIIGLEA